MARSVLAVLSLGLVAVSLSGGTGADPSTPDPAPGRPPPYLGSAVLGSGGLTASVDAYGQIVDLRPSPAGPALILNPYGRQRYGTVELGTGLGIRAGANGALEPFWHRASVRQRYLRGTNVLLTTAWVSGGHLRIVDAVDPRRPLLARRIVVVGRSPRLLLDRGSGTGVRCESKRSAEPRRLVADAVCAPRHLSPRPDRARGLIGAATRSDRRWLARARPLSAGAPAWARRLHDRSLLVLRALTDRRSGAQVAGARDFWAHVWPRDAASGAIALDAAGYRPEARQIVGFLDRLDADHARFHGDGSPVEDRRDPPGDAVGWIGAARKAAGLVDGSPGESADRVDPDPLWKDREDYGEDARGDYLGNAIASGSPQHELLDRFATSRGLVRRSGDPGSGLDSTAAWAVAPFPRPQLAAAARATLLRLVDDAGRYGIVPGEGWPARDAWTAPTAWSAWALVRLGEDRAADRLLARLRRAANPAGLLPERVSQATGVPRSTTPLAWSHAMAILALRARYG